MQTTILMLDCDANVAEELSEALCHIPGVCESYVTPDPQRRIIAVIRVPEAEMTENIRKRIAGLDGVISVEASEVLSVRAGDDLARIREDYE